MDDSKLYRKRISDIWLSSGGSLIILPTTYRPYVSSSDKQPTEVTIIPNWLIDDSKVLLNEIEVFQTHLSADNYIITRTDVRKCLENISKYLKIIIEYGKESRRNI